MFCLNIYLFWELFDYMQLAKQKIHLCSNRQIAYEISVILGIIFVATGGCVIPMAAAPCPALGSGQIIEFVEQETESKIAFHHVDEELPKLSNTGLLLLLRTETFIKSESSIIAVSIENAKAQLPPHYVLASVWFNMLLGTPGVVQFQIMPVTEVEIFPIVPGYKLCSWRPLSNNSTIICLTREHDPPSDAIPRWEYLNKCIHKKSECKGRVDLARQWQKEQKSDVLIIDDQYFDRVRALISGEIKRLQDEVSR